MVQLQAEGQDSDLNPDSTAHSQQVLVDALKMFDDSMALATARWALLLTVVGLARHMPDNCFVVEKVIDSSLCSRLRRHTVHWLRQGPFLYQDLPEGLLSMPAHAQYGP